MQVGGPDYLRNVDPERLDRVVQIDCPLTPSVVNKGVDQLLEAEDRQLVLGYQRTFESAGGGGAAALRPLSIAIINAPAGTYPASQLWVAEGGLLHGPDRGQATELTGVDYLLLRVATRRYRDDWEALSTIGQPFNKAIAALTQANTSGNANVAAAELYIRLAAAAALSSPDLAARDRAQVARAMRQRYDEYRAALFSSRDLKQPPAPGLADVAATARRMDASPVSVDELFAG